MGMMKNEICPFMFFGQLAKTMMMTALTVRPCMWEKTETLGLLKVWACLRQTRSSHSKMEMTRNKKVLDIRRT
jgi:hypothetical protein